MSSLRYLMRYYERKFRLNHIPEPSNSIFIITEKLTKMPFSQLKLYPKIKISTYHYIRLQRYAYRRLFNEPLQYIFGTWDFRQLSLIMKKPVFIPRPETEGLIDIVFDFIGNQSIPKKFLEIGCGTGAISISLIRESTNWIGDAIDKNIKCVELTTLNAKRNLNNSNIQDKLNKLNIMHMNFEQFVKEYLNNPNQVKDNYHELKQYDFIVSNPPYIPSSNILKLEKQVRLFESHAALDGGIDGLDTVNEILLAAPKLLKLNGYIFLEVDRVHPTIMNNLEYQKLYERLGLTLKSICKDCYGQDRFVILQKSLDIVSL